MVKYISILVFIFNYYASTYSIIILVHGTFGVSAPWCRPKGDFYTSLEKAAYDHGEAVVPFAWSGNLSDKARLQAAEALAQVIRSYLPQKIVLIGHSHGGNVLILATQHLAFSCQELAANNFTSIPAFLEAYKKKKSISSSAKNYLIDSIYLLGTPVDKQKYYPNMDTVQHVYNFYSKTDKFQSLIWFYKQAFDTHERIVNFQTLFCLNKTVCHPSHEEMHHPVIAQWLLAIPHTLKDRRVGRFENFAWNYTGKITFYPDAPPSYIRTCTRTCRSTTIIK